MGNVGYPYCGFCIKHVSFHHAQWKREWADILVGLFKKNQFVIELLIRLAFVAGRSFFQKIGEKAQGRLATGYTGYMGVTKIDVMKTSNRLSESKRQYGNHQVRRSLKKNR
ncbi:MAG: hypothetical protein ACMUIL_03755 [bacterium]